MPELTSIHKKFIHHWGEMGTRWGISRSGAQIHALLYISPGALNAEEIAATLSIARSNVSNSIKELQSWGLVKTIHVIGDRKDRFETMEDVWEMFRVVMDGRKRREVDPTVIMLEECVGEIRKSADGDRYTRERLEALQEFFATATDWYEQTRGLSISSFRKLAGMAGWVMKALKFDRKKA
ncbi:MAG: MarR family transcriptional regulator [Planctomycetes bacterium]|nr:MarR family transcriptional regulator [Planctomycetota bacterium]